MADDQKSTTPKSKASSVPQNVEQRIMQAAREGRRVHLTVPETLDLARHPHIRHRAEVADLATIGKPLTSTEVTGLASEKDAHPTLT